MRWRGRRQSSQVEDLRGRRVSGGRLGGGLAELVTILFRTFGLKGVIVVAVLGFFAWKMGLVDPSLLSQGSVASQQVSIRPEEQQRFEFVRVVLADTEDVWRQEFARLGQEYRLPRMTVYRSQVPTACGPGSATMGPFYCPADQQVYIDLSFYDELARTFQAPGDFAQAYVIAHEVGHHVQKLTGVSEKVASMRGRPDYNEWSVRLELQADFLAGVWAHHSREYLEDGDIEEAMRAANAIGDDAIQKRMQGKIVPHSFTHGTSEQRMRWFMKGLKSGRIEDGDTFSMAYADL
ncbi:MAG: KPN_02809 family neutral zinc metallopeptidase [Verrucomicrobiales bacterium]